jgi:hypothetical protein
VQEQGGALITWVMIIKRACDIRVQVLHILRTLVMNPNASYDFGFLALLFALGFFAAYGA